MICRSGFHVLAFVLLVCSVLTSGATAAAGELAPDLEAVLAAAGPDDMVPAIVVLEAFPDKQGLLAEVRGLEPEARRARVVKQMRDLAGSSQAPVRTLLAQAPAAVEKVRVLWGINGVALSATPDVLKQLARLSEVRVVLHDPELPPEEVMDVDGSSDAPTGGDTSGPNPGAAVAPEVVAMGAQRVWEELGYTGAGVIVAVLDNGFDHDHPDLADHWWTNQQEASGVVGEDDDQNGYADDTWGWDFCNDDNEPTPPPPGTSGWEHGTQAAGQVAGDGTGDGTEAMVTGMAPDAEIMALKINCEVSEWFRASDYAIANGAHVISQSFSKKWTQQPDYEAFRRQAATELAAGLIHANSTGNTGLQLSSRPVPHNVSTPGDCPPPWRHPDQVVVGGATSVIGAANIDWSTDTIAEKSPYGPAAWEDIRANTDPNYPHDMPPEYRDYPYENGAQMGLLKPDLAAYGGNTTSTCPLLANDFYCDFGGTSSATPHIAGVLALMRSANPQATPEQLAEAILTTAEHRGAPGKNNRYGVGLVQAYDAVRAVACDSVIADFSTTPSAAHVGDPVFFDSDVQGGSLPYSYQWDFDGDEIVDSTEENPTWVFQREFDRTVWLRVEDVDGCLDTAGHRVSVTGPDLWYDGYIDLTEVVGNGNGGIDPGETWELTVNLRNDGSEPAVGVFADITADPASPGSVTLLQASSTYADIDVGEIVPSDLAYRFRIESDVPCDEWISLSITTTSTEPDNTYPEEVGVIRVAVGDPSRPWENMASAHDVIVDNATANSVSSAGPGSPNRLLYLPGVGGGPPPGNWGLDRSNQRSLPLDANGLVSGTGVGVSVYVVGTGIRVTHQEFTGRAQCFFDWEQGNDCADGHGSGTYVASVVAGDSYGWATGAQVRAVRVFDNLGSGSDSDITAGLDAIAAQGQIPGVVVLPTRGGESDEIDAAVQRVIDAGFYVVAAAGNGSTDACDESPARVPEILTVGATDQNDDRASFSNWGPCLDLFAPGYGITGAWRSSDTASRTLSGTDAEAALVAGAIAIHAEWGNLLANEPGPFECEPFGGTGSGPENMASAHDVIVDNATADVVTNAGPGSPNRLLYLPGAIGGPSAASWGLDRSNQRSLPLDNNGSVSGTGAGAHVYVVGTGIRMTHQEFTGRAQCFFDWEPGNDCADGNGSGTYIASLVAGESYGWATDAMVHAVRVLNNSGGGSISDITAGLDAIAGHGVIPGVVVLPFGGGESDEIDAAVQRVIDAGFYVVAAAGNGSTDACNESPARVPEILTVGATGINDARASFSNYGPCLDLFAPGDGITGAWHTSDVATMTESGTDAAAALVAGAIAIHAERGDLLANEPAGCPWHLDVIDECCAPWWDGQYNPIGTGGLGYTVWILGTGIDDTNPEFEGRAQQVVNYAGGPNTDENGEGTWMASLVGGRDYGVAKSVQLRGVKVLNALGSGSPAAIISGLEYIQNNADGSSIAVVSSKIVGGVNPSMDNAVNNLVLSGVPVVVPAGNNGNDACNNSPARASNAIAVGAHDMWMTRPSWSAYGSCVDISAPGVSVTGAWHTSDTATNTLSGTSASAAIVAGGLALYGKDAWALINAACPAAALRPSPWRRVNVGPEVSATDSDADGYCLPNDCDDSVATCTTDCTDADSDGLAFCAGDCDDGNQNCTTDCTDGDADGYCLPVDCDDTSPIVWRAPAEVTGLSLEPISGGTRLAWTSQKDTAGPETVNDIVTGMLSDLLNTGSYAAATCLVGGHGDTPYDDMRADPPVGDAYYYLPLARNTCGIGSYGDSSITPDPRDALGEGSTCP